MKYNINGSLSIKPLSVDEQLVVCNDIFRKYECDATVLNDVLRLIAEHGSVESVYDYYNGLYDTRTVDEFIEVLIDENVIIPQKDIPASKVSLAFIGDGSIFNIVSSLQTNTFNYTYIEDANDFVDCTAKFDGVLFFPNDMSYGEALAVNKTLYAFQKPFVVCRYTGEDFIVGPLVFP